MLSFLRKKKRSWVILFLLGTIVFVFVLWGVGSFMTQPRIENIATVNQAVITARELDYHYQRGLETYRNIFQGNLSREALDNLNLRAGVLDELIQKQLILQEAASLGLEATDGELLDSITDDPAFHVDGQLSDSLYRRLLRSRRTTPIQFEAERKENITIRKLHDMVRDSVRVTDGELKSRYRVDKEKINLYFIRLAAKDYLDQTHVTAEKIKEHYRQNKAALKEPLKIQVEYLGYPFTHFSSQVPVDQKKIEQYYDTHRNSEFHQPKAVRLRHILIQIPLDGDLEEQKKQAREKAQGLLQEARAGKDFAKLAKKHSEDPSASRGEISGFLSKGQLMPPLEQATFALKKGGVSDVIETSLGFHIVKAEEIREEKTKSLQEVMEQIVRTLKQGQEKEAAVREAEADRERVLDGTNLAAIAAERGLALKTSKFFTRNEVLKEIGPVREFNRTAFSLFPKQISPVLAGPKGLYLVRLKERREPHTPPLDQIRDALGKNLKEKEAMELTTTKAQSLLGELKEKKSITDLAAAHGLKLEETGWFFRPNTHIPKVGTLLELKRGGISLSLHVPIAERIYSQKEAVFLLVFKERQEVDMEGFEKERTRLRQAVLAEKKQRALRKFIENLKAGARIEVLPEFLRAS